ncbi:hypothetical protein ACTI_71300 [Actinoplanes sp. OR16]|uniref:hypothetical protein n=1 Tax=Actinoplanes sp. OR16 TaxID=946334 RepID=UPI000F70F583|nr:hypothetical protein [Actinoplanes sp. OR16]BBH70445.1 hypothetical protein ACTI_71300 [Actinoplanes sp. OR16]
MDPVPLPRLHFSPRAGQVDEIYGVTREDGRYRLYYANAGGLGEAVSDDLVIWHEQAVSGAPGPGVYFMRVPGEVVRASSSSPVLTVEPDLRDPYVWREADEWRMLLAGPDRIVQYRSSDSLTWEFASDLVAWEDARRPQLFPLGGAWVLLAGDAFAVGSYDGSAFTVAHRGVFGRGGFDHVVTFADAAGRRCALARLGDALSLPWILSVRSEHLLATPHPHLDPYLITGATGLTAAGGEVRDNGELILRMPPGGETLVLTDADIVEVTVEGVSGLGAARRSMPGFAGLRIARLA